MIGIKSLIKRNFKPKFFPDGVCISAPQTFEKYKNVDLDDEEEIVVSIDNELNSKVIDGILFTTKRIISVRGEQLKAVSYCEIERVELPKEKINAKTRYRDSKMNRSDYVRIFKKNGEDTEFRIIYGGIYLLATMLKNPQIKEVK